MSTLWTRDPDTYRALGCVGRHHRGRRPPIGRRYRFFSRAILIGAVNRPYGRAIAKRNHRSVTHIPDRVLTAWRDGKLLGAMVMWLCGGVTTEFCLDQEQQRKLCWQCKHYSEAASGVETEIVADVLLDMLDTRRGIVVD